jgi:hypothetical protein
MTHTSGLRRSEELHRRLHVTPSGIGGPTGFHRPGPVHRPRPLRGSWPCVICCLVHQVREVTSEGRPGGLPCRVSRPSQDRCAFAPRPGLCHALDGRAHRGPCPLPFQRGVGCLPAPCGVGTWGTGVRPTRRAGRSRPPICAFPGAAPEGRPWRLGIGLDACASLRPDPLRGDSAAPPGLPGGAGPPKHDPYLSI